MKTYIALACLILSIGCASYKAVMPTEADVTRMAATYPNLNLAELNRGQMLYEKHCNSCHGYKNPAKKDAAGWNKTVPRMAAKINKKGEVLNQKDQELIIRFLVTMGSKQKVS